MVWLNRLGLLVLLAPLITACTTAEPDDQAETGDPDEIVGANAVARTAIVQSFVLVRVGASDSEIARAVTQQMKPLFGALKGQEIGLADRDANAVDATTFVKDTVDVIDPANPATPVSQLQRVRFTYKDRAVVTKALQYRRAIPTTLLFGDYTANASVLTQTCQSEHRDWGASGIWYNFEPHLSGCQKLITDEATKIDAQRRALTSPDKQITVDETKRWFFPTTVKLATIARTENKYPDYHRVYEDGRVTIASFFGVDKLDDPNDYGAKNYFIFIKTVLEARPELKVTTVEPATDLTTVAFKGKTYSALSPLRVAGWIAENRDLPTEIGYADRAEFRKTVIAQWRDRMVTLGASGTASIGGVSKPVAVEVRVFYGNEEGYGTGAVERYKKAFREVDVFEYTGHSHLGSGPLDSRNYTAADFANKYQVLMVNSCVSFNYYNEYFAMHPGGSKNLDTVTNGLPVYLEGSGLSSARFAIAFIDGKFRSYLDVLTSMKVDLAWERGHDANRVADGESDNSFTPSATPMTLTLPR